MYRAFERRDPAYEGVFWLGVRTTGIFCRPTCRARTPNRENVEFFAAPADALHAGYRPCRKCRPLDHGRKPPPLVEKLLLAVETEPGRRYRDAELHGTRRRSLDRAPAVQALLRHDVPGLPPRAAHGPGAPRHPERKDRARLAARPGLRIRQRIPRGVRAPRRRRAVPRARHRRAAREVAGDAARPDARAGRRPRPAPARLRRPARPRARARDAAEAPVRARAARRAPFSRADRSRARRVLRGHAPDVRRRRSRSPDRRSRCACGKRCGRFRPGRRGRTPSSRGASASRAPSARSGAPTATTGCRSSCRAIASSAPTARSPATAAGSRASRSCSTSSARRSTLT